MVGLFGGESPNKRGVGGSPPNKRGVWGESPLEQNAANTAAAREMEDTPTRTTRLSSSVSNFPYRWHLQLKTLAKQRNTHSAP